jgi:inorganic pyrophosphatase
MADAATMRDANAPFWPTLEALIASSEVVIDRPAGSCHPRYGHLVYPCSYGYLEGTTAADGDGIDVWLGSIPERGLTAVVCTVDLTKRDTELKLLLGCTDEEVETIARFHNSGPQAAIVLRRPRW